MQVSLSLDRQQIEQAAEYLSHIRGGLSKATTRALNWTMARIRTQAVREVRSVAPVAARGLKDYIKPFRATQYDFAAALIISGRDLPLYLFRVRPSKPRSKGQRPPRSGVSAQTGAAGSRKVYPGTFIARMKSGQFGVYRRLGKKRLPIEAQEGPSAAELFEQSGGFDRLAETGSAMLRSRFEHEISFLLSRGK